MNQSGGTAQQSFAAVIVAAGRGERAGDPQEGPKQYRRLAGVPVIARALDPFLSDERFSRIVVAIHPDDGKLFSQALSHCSASERGKVTTVHGGASRQHSVLAGLEELSRGADHAPDFVLIHDAARPFADTPLISRVCDALLAGRPAALPVIAVADTLKACDETGTITRTISRAGLFGAQTPQGFAFETILQAHRKAANAGDAVFTDDASIAEWAGITVATVEGSAINTKLTLKDDIAMADRTLAGSALPDVRTGNGYDVHALGPGKAVTLCGVRIEHDRALLGHSDADVGFHALTDALLATCGAGDIGDHFPPSDPQWKGAASSIFLEKALAIVTEAGGTVMNADVSLIAEAPRIGPHRQAMRQAIADCLSIEIERCSVKATTNERIGFIGREEGIAAIATATVVYRKGQP